MSRVIAIDTPSTRLQVQQQKTTLQIAQIFERAVTIEKTENTITVVPQSSYTVLELHNDEIRIEPVQAVTHIEIAQGLQGEKGDKGDPGSGVMVWQGSYDAAVTYSENDGVSYAGSSYICTTESTGNLPTDTDYWDLLASKGDTGGKGDKGETGATGPQGPAGADGQDGAQGPQGIQGIQGPAGADGKDGADGAPGPQGEQGPTGPQGLQGETGETGPQGPQGETGPQGIQGETGLTGLQGPQGATGVDGAQGPQGLQGNDGADGADGINGIDGTNGTNGLDGDNAYCYIAYSSDASGTAFTTTFDPALDYIAILSTDTAIPSPQASDFAGLWKNYKGAEGADGLDGSNGTNGADGSDGAPGSVWYSGTGAPGAGVGIDGDYYLNDANGDVYYKSGTWGRNRQSHRRSRV